MTSAARPSTARLWLRLTPLHLFALVALAACVAGGFWQLGAYESRQGDAARESAAAAPAPIVDVWGLGQPFRTDLQDRRVTVEGRFGPVDEQFWVRGEMTRGDVWLVAPFVVDGSDGALLVVRGRADPSAERDAAIPAVPEGRQQLLVVLQPSQGGGSPLGRERTTTAITTPSLLNELPYRLWSGYGLLDTPAPDGALAQGWTPVEPPDPDVSWTVGLKNLAYALQWWVFGLFAVVMWWRMCRDQVDEARARHDAAPPERPADRPDDQPADNLAP